MNRLLVLSSVALVLSGCGMKAVPACGPDTCMGCCDMSGACQPGDQLAACGQSGAACGTCDSTQTCSMGACMAGGGDAGTDAGAGGGGGSNVYPGPHPSYPQVILLDGGHVLAHPHFIPISFSDDDAGTVALFDDFVSKIGGSTYWTAVTAEYGVGPGVSEPPVHLAEVAPTMIDDHQIQTWLVDKIDAGLGASVVDPIFAVVYPPTSVVTYEGETACARVLAWHGRVNLAGTEYSYAVMPHCPMANGQTDTQLLTRGTSHEFVEASTDPHFPRAFGAIDEPHGAWQILLGTETGDLCAQNHDAFYTPTDVNYLVQRSWSNAAAAAGHDPCVPAPAGEVYFAAVPVVPDIVDYTFSGDAGTMPGVHIPLGQSKTIDVQLFSDAPTTPFQLQAQAVTGSMRFSWDRTQGVNGDVAHLTITPTTFDAASGGAFFVVFAAHSNADYHWVPAFVH